MVNEKLDETFYGYLFWEIDGNHLPSVPLNTFSEMMRFCLTHGEEYPEIRITDGGDHIVIQMIENKFIYPQEWESFNLPAHRATWWTRYGESD